MWLKAFVTMKESEIIKNIKSRLGIEQLNEMQQRYGLGDIERAKIEEKYIYAANAREYYEFEDAKKLMQLRKNGGYLIIKLIQSENGFGFGKIQVKRNLSCRR